MLRPENSGRLGRPTDGRLMEGRERPPPSPASLASVGAGLGALFPP